MAEMAKKAGRSSENMEETGANIEDHEAVLAFFVIPILEYLMDLRRLRQFCRDHTSVGQLKDSLVLGYCFLIVLLIDRVIHAIIDMPALFGLRSDSVIERAHQGNVPFIRMPYSSDQGKVVRNTAELYRPLLGIRSFREFHKETRDLRTHLLPLLKRLLGQFTLSPVAKSKLQSMPEVLKFSAVVGLHLFAHDRRFIRIAYIETFLKSRGGSARLPLTLRFDRGAVQEFFRGYKLAIRYVWHCMFGDPVLKTPSIHRISKVSSWQGYDNLYEDVQREVVEPIENKFLLDPLSDSIFIRSKGVDTKTLQKLLLPARQVKQVAKKTEEELDEVFLWYPTRAVVFDDPAIGSIGFVSMVQGLKGVSSGKIHIVRFIHPTPYEGQNDYSYAILIPTSTWTADYSTWWLYVDFCTDYSGMGGEAHRVVENCLDNHKDRIHVSEKKVSSKVLREYLRRRSRARRINYKQLAEEFRGIILELLTFVKLSALGYDARWRYRDSSTTENKEIDVLAFGIVSGKPQLIVVECSTEPPDRLTKELMEKMKIIGRHRSDLARVFGSSQINGGQVCGWLVSPQASEKAIRSMGGRITIFGRKWLEDTCREYLIRKGEFDVLFPLKRTDVLYESGARLNLLW